MHEKVNARIDVSRGLIPTNPAYVADAEDALNKAIKLIPASDPGKRLSTAYFNRASARRFLGRGKEADEDIREAYRLAPKDPAIAAGIALLRERASDLAGAIAALEALDTDGRPREATFLLAMILNDRGGVGDREKAAAILEPWMQDLGSVPKQMRADVVALWSTVSCDIHQAEKAKERVRQIPDGVLPVGTRDIILGRILADLKDQGGAKEALRRGTVAMRESGAWEDRRQAAMLAYNLGEYRESLVLWRMIVSPSMFNRDTLHALHTARLAQDDAFILEHCRALRKHGVEDRQVYEAEIDALLRCREQREAVSLMQKWLETHLDDAGMRLTLSLVALERGESQLVETDPAKLPAVSAVTSAPMGAGVYRVLRHGPQPLLAAQYAYDLWRRFPDEIAAQHTLIAAVLDPSPGKVQFVSPEVVEKTSAVHYREVGTQPLHVAVIEAGEAPSPTRQEYGPTHPLAQALLGKRLNEEFTFQGHRYVVMGIESKIVFRARECMEGFELTFPNNKVIQRFSIPPHAERETDPKKVFGEVFQHLEEGHKRNVQLEEMYAKKGMPIAFLAHAMARTVIETMAYLAANHNLGIRCSIGDESAWQKAGQLVRSVQAVVLDSTAIATMFMLNLHRKLRDLPFRCIVADAAIQEIREYRERLDHGPEQFGYLGWQDGHPILHEVSPEQEAARARQLDDLLLTIRTDCEIAGGGAILDLPAAHRDGLVKALGESTADAIALAYQRKIPLWTDDHAAGAMAAREWGVQPVWTQSVLLAVTPRIDLQTVSDAIGSLFLWRYNFTRLTVDAAFGLLRKASWEPDREPVKLVLSYISALSGLSAWWGSRPSGPASGTSTFSTGVSAGAGSAAAACSI